MRKSRSIKRKNGKKSNTKQKYDALTATGLQKEYSEIN